MSVIWSVVMDPPPAYNDDAPPPSYHQATSPGILAPPRLDRVPSYEEAVKSKPSSPYGLPPAPAGKSSVYRPSDSTAQRIAELKQQIEATKAKGMALAKQKKMTEAKKVLMAAKSMKEELQRLTATVSSTPKPAPMPTPAPTKYVPPKQPKPTPKPKPKPQPVQVKRNAVDAEKEAKKRAQKIAALTSQIAMLKEKGTKLVKAKQIKTAKAALAKAKELTQELNRLKSQETTTQPQQPQPQPRKSTPSAPQASRAPVVDHTKRIGELENQIKTIDGKLTALLAAKQFDTATAAKARMDQLQQELDELRLQQMMATQAKTGKKMSRAAAEDKVQSPGTIS